MAPVLPAWKPNRVKWFKVFDDFWLFPPNLVILRVHCVSDLSFETETCRQGRILTLEFLSPRTNWLMICGLRNHSRVTDVRT